VIIKQRKWERGYKEGSFPLLKRIELRKEEEDGMLPNTRWETTHLATLCAQTLALQEIFKADQTGMKSKRSYKSEISGGKAQSKNKGGSLIATIVSKESLFLLGHLVAEAQSKNKGGSLIATIVSKESLFSLGHLVALAHVYVI
jgi:hypothetical protein